MSHFAVPHVLDALGVVVGFLGWCMASYLAFIADPEETHQLWPFVFFTIGTFFVARHAEVFGPGPTLVTFISWVSILAGLALEVVLFHLVIESNGQDRPSTRLLEFVETARDLIRR